MASSPSNGDIPSEATPIVRRYLRVERPISAGVGLVVVATAAVAFLFLPLFAGLLVVVAVVGLVRIPVFGTGGTTRLVTEADPESVATDFESATPPVLAFQWGSADDVAATTDGGVYEFAYLFGLRSLEMVVSASSPTLQGESSVREIDLDVTANGKPWGTYHVSVAAGDGETVVDVEWSSERRFGLRYLPQWMLASRYRDDALAAQGYTTVERNASLSL